MILETEESKGFLVGLQSFCFFWYLGEEKKLWREWDIYIKLEKKGAYRNI